MGIVFSIPGERDATQVSRGGGGAGGAAASPLGEVREAVRVGTQRGAEGVLSLEADPGEDLVVLQIEDGPELVLHPEYARDLLLAQAGVRHRGGGAAPQEEITVPARLAWRGLAPAGASRGLLDGVRLESFKLLGRRVKQELADLSVEALLRHFDGQVTPGLHRLKPDSLEHGSLQRGTLADLASGTAGSGPLLVLIHGTFSSTAGTFGKLWSSHPRDVERLFQAYAGRVHALEHATLGCSPVENARDLARSLPRGAVLHLLTHSRGGLVAEVLARACAPAGPAGHGALGAGAPQADAQALQELVSLVREKGLRVERVVRVACPARGTLLASRRLDAYLSVLRWLMKSAGLRVLPELVDFLGEVARRRLDPEQVPGLAAQVPGSALVDWLHAVGEPIPGSLRVVAGDVQGDSIVSWVKTLLTDAYYWTDNDFVVQTRSMYGGAPRSDGAVFMLSQGGEVSHFGYFSHPKATPAIVEALLQPHPAGFAPIGPLSWAGLDAGGVRAASRPDPAKPAVVLLPGIAGSNLKVHGERVWLGKRVFNGLLDLAYRPGVDDGVEPDGPVSSVYGELAAFLARSHEVIEFAFDWRKPIEVEARRLGSVVAQALKARADTQQPVRLLAHSMGGLVVRAMEWVCRDVWSQLMNLPGARVLMLGTPNGGSWAPMQVLSGDDTFGNTLTAVGAPFRDHKARAMLAGFPGLVQMQMGLLDPALRLGDVQTWRKLVEDDIRAVEEHNSWHRDGQQLNVYRWSAPTPQVLQEAVALRGLLDEQRDARLSRFADKLALVLGTAPYTPEGFEIGAQGLVYREALHQGDGRVLDRSAMLPGVATWRTDCDHGTLAEHADAFAAYLDLLTTGSTTRLEAVRSPRGPRGGVADRPVLRRPSREALPPLEGLNPLVPPRAPAGASMLRRTAPMRVQLLNGDLGFVRQPLLVGHYASLALTGTEAVVDRLLGGSLGRSLRAGLYPQELGTQQVFINTRVPAEPWQLPEPEAVVVVGLGPEGKLRPAELVQAVQAGVLAWAVRRAESPDVPDSLQLAATLIGSGGLGITAGQAAQLVVQGVSQANARLAEASQAGQAEGGAASSAPLPTVSRLVLVELYLDRATEAWRALNDLQDGSRGDFMLEKHIERTEGALARPLDAGYRGADYDLIIASAEVDSLGDLALAYRVDSRRARSEMQAVRAQSRLLRQLLSDDGRQDIGATLYRLLVPLEMRRFLVGSTETLLDMDETCAAIPWELLDPPAEAEAGAARAVPWAIRTKLLRKLRSENFRLDVQDAPRDAGVLIIGEPACPEGYARLPGARREAWSVAARLRAAGLGALVREIIAPEDGHAPGANAATITKALMSGKWRMVHIAGHGEPPLYAPPRPGEPDESPQRLLNRRGVVLSDDIFLGPYEIANMQPVPELVFVNCCFSGTHGADAALRPARGDLVKPGARPAFAANVAQQLIRIGVRCVVATGWAVDDAAAAQFATTFYDALLRGQRFMDAVARARESARRVPGSGDTWGAYQCYGDPDWRFQPEAPDAQRPARQPSPQRGPGAIASAPALVLALRTLATQAGSQNCTGQEKKDRAKELDELAEAFEPVWGSSGEVAEAFGAAFKAVGDTAQAIRWLRLAVRAEDGTASLRAAEDLHNLSARQAWSQLEPSLRTREGLRQRLRAAQARAGEAPDGALARELRDRAAEVAQAEAAAAEAAKPALLAIQQALQGLEQLNRVQATAERLSLCGSTYKRMTQVQQVLGQGDEARASLGSMKDCYEAAWKQAAVSAGAQAFYPAMNLLAAVLLDPQAPAQRVAELAAAALEAADESQRLQPKFWSAVALIEIPFWEALAGGTLQARRESLLEAFGNLHARVPDVNKWRSVHDQARFMADSLRERSGFEAEAADAVLGRLAAYAYPAS